MNETEKLRAFLDLTEASRKCMFGTGYRLCGRPAVLHVLVNDRGARTMCCERHADRWLIQIPYDKHPLCGECGLPGTTWVLSTDTPGRCVIEGLDLPDLFATEAELVGATG
ncbi:MAG TPA: hypothetical protein VKA83_22215 [Methylomirabilota bacterium]|nr:hypothetical protein [Methylomirabilota bacterium]